MTDAQMTTKLLQKPSGSTRLATPVLIESIATGVPDLVKKQSDAAGEVADLFESSPEQQERIRRLYAKTKIRARHMAVDPLGEDFDRNMSIRQRMSLFLTHATPLAIEVCLRALTGAQVTQPGEQIGMLVLVTSTGLVAPGVDVAVMMGLGLSASVSRVVVNFMGCAAAMNGLRAAADFVRSHPNSKALVCCIELSSVNAVFAESINDIIISSLFADGCAAMVVGSGISLEQGRRKILPGQIVIRHQFNHFMDNSIDGITLGVNANGITCDLSPSLPSYIRTGLGPIVINMLAQQGMTKADVHLWAIHPGGPKIIEESVCSLAISNQVADSSWGVLTDFGNMLSASLPFVLERMVAATKEERPVSTGVAFSFAPGVTVEGMLFEVVGNNAATASV